jgi:hypothetical protein
VTRDRRDQAVDSLYAATSAVVGGSAIMHRLQRRSFFAMSGQGAAGRLPFPFGLIETRLNDRVRSGVAVAREFFAKVKGSESDPFEAYQTALPSRIALETVNAISGKGGPRVYSIGNGFGDIPAAWRDLLQAEFGELPATTRHGDIIRLGGKSPAEIKDAVGAERWPEFGAYGQMKAALARYEKAGHLYPGMADENSPEVLRKRIPELELAHPEWVQAFKDVNGYFDNLLKIDLLSGEHAPKEAIAMKRKWPEYWSLLRVVEDRPTPRGGGGAEPTSGIKAATGHSAEAIRPLDEILQERTRRTLDAYYTNRFGLALAGFTHAVGQVEAAPYGPRKAIERLLMPLKLEAKMIGKTNPGEEAQIIADYLNKKAAEEGSAERVSASEIEVAGPGHEIWRMRKPTAVRVIRLWKGGEPAYFQVTDPLIFDLMRRGIVAGPWVNWLSRMSRGIVAPWKRAITQNLVFAFRNALARDPATAMYLGESGRKDLVPYLSLANGLVGRLRGGQIDAALSTELLSRSFDEATSASRRGTWASFQAMLGEGITRNAQGEEFWGRLADLPGRAMSTFLKPIDVFNWLSGGRYLSQQGEALAREGAYKLAKERGATDAEAQVAYDQITGNFGEQGTNGNLAALTRSAGFLNPSLQIAWQQFAKVTHPDPEMNAHFMGLRMPMFAVYGAMAAASNHLLMRALYPDDDDRKAAYEQQRERGDRDKLSFMALGGKIRVPMPDGVLGGLFSFGYNAVDQELLRRPISAKDEAMILFTRARDLPGLSDFIQPQAKTMFELYLNHSFYLNDEIVPTWLEDAYPYDPALQAYPDTPTVYKWLGGAVQMSPLKVRYAVQQAFSRQIDEFVTYADRVLEGRPVESKDLPVVGRLMQPESRGYRSQAVRSLKDLDARWKSIMSRIKDLQQAPEGSAVREQLPDLRKKAAELAEAHGQMLAVVRLFKAAKRLAAKPGNDEAVKGIERQMVTVARRYLEKAELPAQAPPAP